jgi:LmbE family N-acetylglucosaminyl deacetylase
METLHFALPEADVFVPDGAPAAEALGRATHLGIGAHQDDLEMMAFHGIAECFGIAGRGFAGVTCTDGGGSPRAGRYAACTDERMKQIRAGEQRAAAAVGRYAAMIQLGYPSAIVKNPADPRLEADLAAILRRARPRVVYTHNLADKHDTHVAVACAALRAIRSLPAPERPERVYGCEVWRDLDWLCGPDKAVLDVSGHTHLAAALLGVFDSQIAGGKRYDLATLGRRRANATYGESHAVDTATEAVFAMDLTPLAQDGGGGAAAFVLQRLRRFEEDVSARIGKASGHGG